MTGKPWALLKASDINAMDAFEFQFQLRNLFTVSWACCGS